MWAVDLETKPYLIKSENVDHCVCPEAQLQSLQGPYCASLMSWSLQWHTGKLRLNGARSHVWDTPLDFSSGLSDPQIPRDPHCLLWVEVGQDKTKA